MQYIRIYACGLSNYGWTWNILKSSDRLKQEFETKNKYKFCLDFSLYCNVLYLNIHPDTLKNFNKNTIIGEVLWEITFHGYSPDDINSFCTKLTNSFDNYK